MQWRQLCLIGVVLGAPGCRGDVPPPAADGEHRRRDVASLPAVGEHLPPVDDGKLAIAPPAGWQVIPRGRTFLVGFAKGQPQDLPRILITADLPPADCPADLTTDNAEYVSDLLAAGLEAEAKTGRKRVPEYHLPIVLGETMFIRHVRHASLSGKLCAVQSLQTLRGGRLYTVDLLVQIDAQRPDDYGEVLKHDRDVAYAVAAHLKFATDEQPQNPQPAPPAATNP